MSWAGTITKIKVPKERAEFVKLLVNSGFADTNQTVVELAVALGLRLDEREDFEGQGVELANIRDFDPDGVLAEVILAKYRDLAEGDRVRAVNEHAAAGLRMIAGHFEKNGSSLEPASIVADLTPAP